MPCGKITRPAPKLFTSLPVESNFNTGSSVDVRHEFVPQRSPTHTLVPSLSISTELVEPHVRPSGSLAQPSTVRNGLGRSFFALGVGACACVCAVAIARLATATAARGHEYLECFMSRLSRKR